MKLITAIVNRRDTSEVCAALTDAGFYFTRMASTGGFLTGGNSTLLIGTEEDRVPQAIAIIRQNCSRRTEKISSKRAAGHALCGLSHGGDRRRCHAVRLRCDAV